MHRVGFMQGRLSPQVDGKIQAFPWQHWEDEFFIGGRAGFDSIEWTLDQQRLRENPLLLDSGRGRIRELRAESGIDVRSLTGDCFMQAPFWKASDRLRDALLEDLDRVLEGCAALGIRFVVMPLVDNGRLENARQHDVLLDALLARTQWLIDHEVGVLFESELPARELASFIERFPRDSFGINYDIGNSASLGYDPRSEIRAYGDRIKNVHVKDRLPGGPTVPLGDGAADFPIVFDELARAGYRGDFILQTARAADGEHLSALVRYREMVRGWVVDP